MSSEQQTMPQTVQGKIHSIDYVLPIEYVSETGSETLLRRLQELILDDSTTKKWKSVSANLLPAIVKEVTGKIIGDLSDGPQRTRFIKTLGYLQPNARQFQDFVRFVMTTNLNQATLTVRYTIFTL